MSRAEDVNTLFRRFGGDAGTYQEIVATQQVDSAKSKWPMLDQIRVQIPPTAPSEPLASLANQERLRQAVVTSAPLMSAPLTPALAPEAVPTVAPVVGRSVSSVGGNATGASVSPVVSAVPVVSAGVGSSGAVAAEAVASKGSGLQSMFRRMVGQRQTPSSTISGNPIKRLAKW